MEKWKDIPGYEKLYQASTHGRIRSLPRTRATPGARRRSPGKILRPGLGGAGYEFVALCRDGRRVSDYVHRIVWITFRSPIPKKWEINHKDANRRNNRLRNLEVGTRRDNFDHAMANKLNKICLPGEANPGAKLTEKEVLQIRDIYKPGINSMRKIAAEFGVCTQLIEQIINRRIWKHI
jgi:hypothetical protein